MKVKFAAMAVFAVGVAGCAAMSQPLEVFGYLHGGKVPDTIAILPPAPAPDSPEALADRAVFKATRALKDTPRWTLAQQDVAQSIPFIMKDYSCALGVNLTPEKAPKLNALFRRVGVDVLVAVNRPKDRYQSRRPFLLEEGDICVPRSEGLAKSPDYPSGHSTWGWTTGLLLAELAPERATKVLVRARAYGESRAVCGVHSASAVAAGSTNAAALVAALHGSKAFRSDLAAAQSELAALKGSDAPDAEACKAEADLTAHTPW